MNPPMTRWKIVPVYSGSVVFSRVAGWVHSRRPSARSAKLATVFGAWSGKRSTVMSPWLVCSTARRAEVDSVTAPLCHRHANEAVQGRRPGARLPESRVSRTRQAVTLTASPQVIQACRPRTEPDQALWRAVVSALAGREGSRMAAPLTDLAPTAPQFIEAARQVRSCRPVAPGRARTHLARRHVTGRSDLPPDRSAALGPGRRGRRRPLPVAGAPALRLRARRGPQVEPGRGCVLLTAPGLGLARRHRLAAGGVGDLVRGAQPRRHVRILGHRGLPTVQSPDLAPPSCHAGGGPARRSAASGSRRAVPLGQCTAGPSLVTRGHALNHQRSRRV